jgi:predicted unusual protein kinase regulating ubiquinone biosynthesis (AarF/ABC1/UbiB family)
VVTLVTLRAYWRFLLVVYQFFPLIVAYARDRRRFFLFGGSRQVDSATRTKRAQILLDSLLTLGPTFIKLGQLLSSRPDVLPPEYLEVLSSLQDDVPPAPWEEAREVIAAELGPPMEVFDEFETEAISGASLGQVYVGTYQGERVAVKVRRPNIEDLVEADLRVIRWSLPAIMYFLGETRAFSLENLADEFAKTIRQEMDYTRERSMLEEIRRNFRDNDRIIIPNTIAEVSGPRVLTMEYVPGTKINDIQAIEEMGVDRYEVARQLERLYLQMVIEDGVFHADPHPGNLAVTEEGRIIFYDFGMNGQVEPFIQEKIVDFYIAVANQDIDGILDSLIEMGTLSPEADREVMGDVMELAIADARGEDIEQYRVQQIIGRVEDTIYEFPLRLPRNLALVLRVATVVEGVCVTLDPDFDFIAVATEFLTERGYREESIQRFVEATGEQFQRTGRSLVTVPPKLERFLDRAERDSLSVNVRLEDRNDVLARLARRIVYGVLSSVGILAVALLYAFEGVEPALVGGVLTTPVLYGLYRSFRKRKGLKAKPQFTRQAMRERREQE